MAVERIQVVDAQVIDGATGDAAGPRKGNGRRKVSWSLLVSGILFALLGIVCFAWPGLALETIALAVGIGFLVGGIGAVVDFALSGAFRVFSGWLLVSGIAEVVLGLLFLSRPLVSVWMVSTFLAVAVIAVGALQVASAVRLRRMGGRAWMFEIATGVISIVLGILMIANPATLVYCISGFTVVYGVALVVLAFKVPKLFG